MKHLPGFVSANIHRRLDGSNAAALAKFDPIFCEVVEAIDRG